MAVYQFEHLELRSLRHGGYVVREAGPLISLSLFQAGQVPPPALAAFSTLPEAIKWMGARMRNQAPEPKPPKTATG